MAIREALIRAYQADDLSPDSPTVDLLGAAGLASIKSKVGSCAHRVAASAGERGLIELAEVVQKLCTEAGVGVPPEELQRIALLVILRWLSPCCSVCRGRGFRVIPGTGRLSDKACEVCGGGGWREVNVDEKQLPLAKAMGAAIEECCNDFERQAGRFLRRRRRN